VHKRTYLAWKNVFMSYSKSGINKWHKVDSSAYMTFKGGSMLDNFLYIHDLYVFFPLDISCGSSLINDNLLCSISTNTKTVIMRKAGGVLASILMFFVCTRIAITSKSPTCLSCLCCVTRCKDSHNVYVALASHREMQLCRVPNYWV